MATLNLDGLGVALRNSNGVVFRASLLLFYRVVHGVVDRAFTSFVNRLANGVVDRSLTSFVHRFHDCVVDRALTSLVDRLANGVVDRALVSFVHRFHDRVVHVALVSLVHRLLDRVVDHFFVRFVHGFHDRVLHFAFASFVHRLFHRVVDHLFMSLVHRFHDRVVDLTLTRLVNRLHHGVLNFALFRVRNHTSALNFFVFVVNFVTRTVTGLFALFPDSFRDVTHHGVRIAIAGRCLSRLTFGYIRITTICTAGVADGTAISGVCGLSSNSDQHDRSSLHKPQPLHLCFSNMVEGCNGRRRGRSPLLLPSSESCAFAQRLNPHHRPRSLSDSMDMPVSNFNETKPNLKNQPQEGWQPEGLTQTKRVMEGGSSASDSSTQA